MIVVLFVKSAVVALVLALSFSHAAFAFETKPYEAAQFKAAQDAGKSVLIDVYAPWCPTCKAQRKVLDTLKDKPDYASVTVFEVDFDTQTDALKALAATQQSTLIAFKGTKETGRSVGATKADAIEALLMSSTK